MTPFNKKLTILFFALLVSCWLEAQTTFVAHLSGRNETINVTTAAAGAITATLDGNELKLSGSFSGLSSAFNAAVAGGSHIHQAYAGQNGGIVLSLVPTLDPDLLGGTYLEAQNTFTLTEDQKTALLNRQFYVNIHTLNYTGGELRGQLLPASDEHFRINLLGSNEVPAVMSAGRGSLVLELTEDTLVVTGAFSQLEGDFAANIAGGVHLHQGLVGQNGGIQIALNPTVDASLKSGVFLAANNKFTLTAEQKAMLRSRAMYANIHTTKVTSGEIRGQAAGMADVVFRAHLAGANEVPSIVSAAQGVVQVELFGDSILLSGSFANLEGAVATQIAGGAHIHQALAGSNGPVIFPLGITLGEGNTSGTFATGNNGFRLTAEQKTALLQRGMYVNIHSAAHNPGELRGQLIPEAQYVFSGELSSIFQLPGITSRGFGGIKAELNGNRLTVSGSFDNLSSLVNIAAAGGAHLHLGLAGQNGGIEFPLAMVMDGDMMGGDFLPQSNVFTLSEAQTTALKARSYYANIHSLNHGGGELRTQLLPEANYYLAAPLSGASENPAFNTTARGMLVLEVAGANVVSSGSFSGLAGDVATNVSGGAHLHTAFAGSNGAITQALNATLNADNRSGAFAAANNQFSFTQEQIDALRDRRVYANIHTTARTSGELRGQCLPFATSFFTATLQGLNERTPNSSVGRGGAKLELHGNLLTVSGSFSSLSGDFAANIAGGSHLHLGANGANGGIAIALQASVDTELKSGAYRAENNVFQLEEAQIEALLAGNFYFNIHSTTYPGGELRGQVLPEINLFPANAPAITLPTDGLAISIAGLNTQEFLAQWTAATDRDALAYIWQLSPTPDFSVIVFQTNVGSALQFATDFGTIDDLLAGAGLPVGGSVTLYHRALASDGSVFTAGAAASVQITRGVIEETAFTANLSGHNEVLPIATMASGSVQASLEGNMLTVSGSFKNLSAPVATNIAGGAHIHLGYAGQNGPVNFPLVIDLDADSLSGSFDSAKNTFTLSESQLAALQARQLYVNIHSKTYTSGELRGQLVPNSDAYFSTNLAGSNEVPSILTRASGALQLELHGSELVVSGSFRNLSGDFAANVAGGSHLHIAPAGRNGGINIRLNATVDANLKGGVYQPENNTFLLNSDQLTALQARNMYANIHTTAFPSGEIRGQVVGAAQAVFRAHLSGANATTAVTSMAEGVVLAEFMNDSMLVVSGSFAGLESPLATNIAGGMHIHRGMAGQNGPIEVPIAPTLGNNNTEATLESAANTFILDSLQRANLFKRGLYVNVHSTVNTGGEIRGQLLPESQAVFTGVMSSIFSMPSAASTAGGQVKAELNGNRLILSGSFSRLSSALATNIAGGVHIHLGMAGSNGPVVFPLGSETSADLLSGIFPAASNQFTFRDGQIDTLFNRGFYTNLHTTNYTSGEIRAQLLPEAKAYFVAPLSGASQTPAVNTPARGMAILEARGASAVLSGSFAGLESDLATSIAGGVHIHAGLAGQNGPVVNLISTALGSDNRSGQFLVTDNRITTSEGWIDTLRNRSYYINLHSLDNQGGVIRGQLLPLATAYFTTTLSGFTEVQPKTTPAAGALKLELNGANLSLSGSFAGLTGAYNPQVAGGSHLHLGFAGNNGGVDIGLTPALSADSLSGSYAATANKYPLTSEQIAALLNGQYYANIHTRAFGSGELRGQILPEVNAFPSADAAILTPADGATVALEGSATTPFQVEWDAAGDRDTLAYVWQLATSPTFDTLLFAQAVGNQLFFATDFQTVDALLAASGLMVGNSITLYHRAVATDGSVATPGPGAAVTINRGTIVGTEDFLPKNISIRLYPTITDETATYEVNLDQTLEATLLISNTMGQLMKKDRLYLGSGRTTYTIDAHNYARGTYFVQLWVNGKLANTQRFIVQ